jgi:hypothetical protein
MVKRYVAARGGIRKLIFFIVGWPFFLGRKLSAGACDMMRYSKHAHVARERCGRGTGWVEDRDRGPGRGGKMLYRPNGMTKKFLVGIVLYPTTNRGMVSLIFCYLVHICS